MKAPSFCPLFQKYHLNGMQFGLLRKLKPRGHPHGFESQHCCLLRRWPSPSDVSLQILVFSSVKWASKTHQVMQLKRSFWHIHPIIVNPMALGGSERERGLEKHMPCPQGLGVGRQQGFGEEERETWNSPHRTPSCELRERPPGQGAGVLRGDPTPPHRPGCPARPSVTSTSPRASELGQQGQKCRGCRGVLGWSTCSGSLGSTEAGPGRRSAWAPSVTLRSLHRHSGGHEG